MHNEDQDVQLKKESIFLINKLIFTTKNSIEQRNKFYLVA